MIITLVLWRGSRRRPEPAAHRATPGFYVMIESDVRKTIESHRDWLARRRGGVRADLTLVSLEGLDLSDVDLREAKLAGAKLARCDLRKANLRRADLFAADLADCKLDGADLSEADLRGARLHGASFVDANLRRADLRDGTLLAAARGGPINVHQLDGSKIEIRRAILEIGRASCRERGGP